MDIMLERMLSLIPKKENGKYVHGAKKEFCEAIGAPTNIVSEWEAGKTKSYRNYLYVVSAKYNVPVEWLNGETNDPSAGIKKERPADGEARVCDLPESIQKIINICLDRPELASALLTLAQQIEKG